MQARRRTQPARYPPLEREHERGHAGTEHTEVALEVLLDGLAERLHLRRDALV